MRTLTKAFLSFAALAACASASGATGSPEPNRIVYWGNTITGKSVRVFNTADAEKKADAQVKAIGGSGWVLLEHSTKPGFGAALCLRKGATIHFYTAHGYASGREAVQAAKAKANGSGTFCSNALWRVAELPAPQKAGAVGAAKGAVFDAVAKEEREGGEEATCKEPKQGLVALPPAGSVNPTQERRDCPESRSNEGTSDLTCTCVRG